METKQWSARLPDHVKEKLIFISKKDIRSLSKEVSYLIEKRYAELKK